MDVIIAIEVAEDEDTGVRVGGEDVAYGLDPAAYGHTEIHDGDIGIEFRIGFRRLEAVDRLADDFEIGLPEEDAAEAFADDKVVICDEDADVF